LEDDEICIITEYMIRGSLYKIIHDKHEKFPNHLRLKISMDVAKGMNYLHKSDPIIVHRDLKSHNLLVDEHFKVKVCDFGLATLLNTSTSKNALTSCGTPGTIFIYLMHKFIIFIAWTAPEVLRNEQYTEKCDVFSYGVVLWELVTREEPWKELDAFQLVWTVGSSKARLLVPSSCPVDIAAVIKDCMDEDPSSRVTFLFFL
jgi:serine/threonine protein kinase